jgi:hypothetical protein
MKQNWLSTPDRRLEFAQLSARTNHMQIILGGVAGNGPGVSYRTQKNFVDNSGEDTRGNPGAG